MALKILTPDDVHNPKELGHYARQRLGTPALMSKEIQMLAGQCTKFFERNPEADWWTLTRIVDWCVAKHFRPKSVITIPALAQRVWADGWLDDIFRPQTQEDDVETCITKALEVETDQRWRRKLYAAQGPTARRQVLAEWTKERGG